MSAYDIEKMDKDAFLDQHRLHLKDDHIIGYAIGTNTFCMITCPCGAWWQGDIKEQEGEVYQRIDHA